MMGLTPNRCPLFASLAVPAALAFSVPSARADLIAGDSFVSGTGGYKSGNLTEQPTGESAPSSFGYSGTYGKTPTSFLVPDPLGLSSAATGYKGATGGSIRMTSTPGVDGASRSLTRTIANSASNPATLYFSGLFQAPKTLAANRGGFFEFGNRVQPGSPAAFLGEAVPHKGFDFGIQGTSFVLRTAGRGSREPYSSTYSPVFGTSAAATNLFVVRLDVKPSGNDFLIIYLNPTDVTSEARARETAAVTLEFDDRDVANHPSDFSNSGFRTLSTAADATPIFGDEVRIGRTFEAVVAPVPKNP